MKLGKRACHGFKPKAEVVCNIAAVHGESHDTCCCQAVIHLEEKRCYTFYRGLAPQKKHVVLDMLKVVGRHGQQALSHHRIGFGHQLQALAFNKANGGVDDGFRCKTMKVAILKAKDVAGQVKRADLAATVG